jgi:polysaccharide export outer membrane protein
MPTNLLTDLFKPMRFLQKKERLAVKVMAALRRQHRRAMPLLATCAAVVLALFLPALLCGQTVASTIGGGGADHGRPFVVPNTTRNMQYTIDAGDVLNVYVVDVAQFSRDYRVASDGSITLPLLSSPVAAEGLTLNQLSAVIADKLRTAELVSHPHVVVTVKSSAAHTVAVSGAVRNPVIYSVFTPTTLLDALSKAGGPAPDAGSTAIITRNDSALAHELAGGENSLPAEGAVRVDLQKLLATGDPGLNVTIYPGDKITVQRAGVVYVVGAVHRPGGFPLGNSSDKMTVLQAVALGEGLKSTALRKKAMIIRRGQQFHEGRKQIPVNLKNILSGHASDPGLEANDILFIPDSTSKRALQRGAEAALQIATGIVIWGRY